MAKDKNVRPIIIKKVEEIHGGHHGGAWKVAYADFMTAMMAFFLLMWLLNITTDEQKRGIALFFNPMADKTSTSSSDQSVLETSPLSQPSSIKTLRNSDYEPTPTPDGKQINQSKTNGMQHGGKEEEGILKSSGMTILPPSSDNVLDPNNNPPSHMEIIPIGGPKSGAAEKTGQVGSGNADTHNAGDQKYIGSGAGAFTSEDENLKKIMLGIQDSTVKDKKLNALAKNLGFKVGSDEIKIELKDTSGKPMFDTGSVQPNKDGLMLLEQIGNWLSTIPEDISIVGATDASPYVSRRNQSGMSNWVLSEVRADKVREFLVQQGYPDRKIRSVEGRGDHDLLDPIHPESAQNRRIMIVVHRIHPVPKDFINHDNVNVIDSNGVVAPKN